MKVFKNFGNRRIAVFVFLFLLACNFYLWTLLNNYIEEKSRLRFENETERLGSIIENRLASYEKVLLAGRGLYNASDNITREEWKIFVDSFDLPNKFPGMQGIGFIIKVTPQNKLEHLNQIRNEGYKEYNINPEGERDAYYPIVFIEPFNEINQRAFGYDMFSEDIRREAMSRARDTNTTAMSGKVILIQDADTGNTQTGLLMYVPIYKKGEKLETSEQRQINHIGYVYSPFRANDLMDGILGKGEASSLSFEIFSTETQNNENLIYDSDSIRHYQKRGNGSKFSRTESLDFGGKRWFIYYETSSQFSAETSINQKYILPISGLLVSFLIPLILYLYANARERALNIAKGMVAKLHESEQQYKTVVNALEEGVILQNANGETITFNKSSEKILGLTKDQLLGKDKIPEEEWYITSEDGLKLSREQYPSEYVRKSLKSQKNIVFGIHSGKDNPTWIKVTSIPILDKEGTLLKVVTSIRDITEQKVAEDELRYYNTQLQRSNEELQNFAYVASHDLQEPLRKITSFSNLLLTKYNDSLPDQGKQFIDIIQKSSKRMSKLITDLLNYSRVTTKALPFTEVNLKEVIANVVDDLQILIEESKAEIKVQKVCTLEADELQMHMLFQNLIINALRYRKKDTPPLIEISSKSVENQCIIHVKDNGIGFDEKYLDKIFIIFQRLHAKNEYEGTGIGLAICKKIVERHNGIITAKSEIEQGSTFIVQLPLKQK